MVFLGSDANGAIEIWDFAGGGDKPQMNSMRIGQKISVHRLIELVSAEFKHLPGTFELLLKWDRNKVNLMDVKGDLTLADIGVDFSSGTTYTLMIAELPSSPSDNDQPKELNAEEDKGQFTEDAVDMSSQSKIMLRVKMMATSPEFKTETKVSTPTDDLNTTGIHFYPEYIAPECPPSEEASLSESQGNVFFDSTSGGITYQRRVRRRWKKMKEKEYDEYYQHCKEYYKEKQPITQENEDSELNRSETDQRRRPIAQENEESELNRGETGYIGLVNQAMTCYLNSLIQALYMTPEFRNALYNWEYVNGSEKDKAKSIPYQLQKLFLSLQTSSKNAIETTSLTKSFGWDSTQAWQQHDIQELCRVMFDALEQKFKNTEQADLIDRLYEGKMMDYVKCLECGTEKSREDTFLDIPLPVRPFGSNVAYNSVEEALAAFVQPETLDGTNQYHCETCNKKCDAHKGLKFTKFPYFLTLHLKRFDFDHNTFHRIKLNDEVTFPDVLNLNSFVSSNTSQDSTSTEEQSSVSIKTDDVSKPDVPITNDDSPPCNNGISVSENSTSKDHEENNIENGVEETKEKDNCIGKSNGPSTSSFDSRNHANAKNHDNLPGPPGPYVYELFSIMIHSGSASGGHYYAYIKDFRTEKWLCFNDQNVSTITYEDIRKTYGGGPTRAYYSGVYSSSSNAYMLMYRQIDPARNTLPMQVADFPKHLQELLAKMQESEESDTINFRKLFVMYKVKVFCYHPVTKLPSAGKIICLQDETLASLTERSYKFFDLDKVVDRDQVRLVAYQSNNEWIDCSFEGREDETLRTILCDNRELLLEIRKKDETFKTYLPGSVAKKIYVIDVKTEQVTKGPITLRGLLRQTIQEYKEKLAPVIGMEAKDINLILQCPNTSPKLVRSNDNDLEEEGFVSSGKIFVPTAPGWDGKKILEHMVDILYFIGGLMSLNIQLPEFTEEDIRTLGIPKLDKKKVGDAIPSGISKDIDKVENNLTATNSNDTDESSPLSNKTTSPSTIETESEDWHTQEQSNSEDSSLSYSDRTLVGEGDASEDDDYPLANVDHELSHQTTQENGQVKDPNEYFCHIARDERDPDRLLRLLIDKRVNLRSLKKFLEPHIGVPSENFRVFYPSCGENELIRLSVKMSTHEEGSTFWIKLRPALRNDEFKASLYQFSIDSDIIPFDFLCEWIISKDATVGETKKKILAKLKKTFFIDIPYERCRLRQKNHKTAGRVLLDNQKFKDIRFDCPCEILIQKLPGKETITNSSQVVLFARRYPSSGKEISPTQELVVNGNSLEEVRAKISEISEIPEEYLEIGKGQTSLPDTMLLVLPNYPDWNWQLLPNDNSEQVTLEDGLIIYYSDSRGESNEWNSSEVRNCRNQRKSRTYGVSPSTISRSRRRERALKIYVDDM